MIRKCSISVWSISNGGPSLSQHICQGAQWVENFTLNEIILHKWAHLELYWAGSCFDTVQYNALWNAAGYWQYYISQTLNSNSQPILWVMGAYGEHLGRTTVGFNNLIAAIRNNKKMRSYIGATRFQYQVVQLATQISLHVREGIMNSVVSEVAHLATRSMRVLSRPALTEILHNHAVPWRYRGLCPC